MPPTDINIYTLKQVQTKRCRYDLGSCQITCPLACFKTLQTILDLRSEPVEKFGIIALNTKNEINGIHIIGSGTINNVNIRPREVFLAAMMNNAESIIYFHNHPSGDPSPSTLVLLWSMSSHEYPNTLHAADTFPRDLIGYEQKTVPEVAG